jgi:hypothetical protein
MHPIARLTLLGVTLCAGAFALAQSGTDAGTEDTGVPETTADFETYSRTHKMGFPRNKTLVGDYATIVPKGWNKSSGGWDSVLKTKTSFITSTSAGATVTTDIEVKRHYVEDDTGVCSSFSESLLDEILQKKMNVSICSDNNEKYYRVAKTELRTTIGKKADPGAAWQLDTVAYPDLDPVGSLADRGYGTLTRGDQALQMSFRGDSPWSPEQCVQMFNSGDKLQLEQRDYCFNTVVEIFDDGELLAKHTSTENVYAFRVGIDDDLKLVLLVALEAFDQAKN